MKNKFCLVLMLLLCASVAFCGCSEEEPPVEQFKFITLEDIILPSGLASEDLGLYAYNPENGTWVNCLNKSVPFDDEKPVLVYAHGMGGGQHIYKPQQWADAGYNVLNFMWGAFSDDDPSYGQSKLWGVNPNIMNWMNEDDVRIHDNVPNCSVTEYFCAVYYKFLSSRNFTGSEIHFSGHSMGGQWTMAATSYLTTAYNKGALDKKYLPDRVTMLDPYFNNASDATYCKWLGKTLEAGGSVGVGLETAKALRAVGTAVELWRTSPYVLMAASLGGVDELYQQLIDEVAHVDVDTAYLERVISPITNAIGARHTYSIDIYTAYAAQEDIYDFSEENAEELALSPLTPNVVTYARMGEKYNVDIMETVENYWDDLQTSTGIENAKVCGFVFKDLNGNGLYDDRIYSHQAGVKLELYRVENGALIDSCTTTESGYYSFEIDSDTLADYYVQATYEGGFSAGNGGAYNSIGTDENGKSYLFKLPYDLSLEVINVCVK